MRRRDFLGLIGFGGVILPSLLNGASSEEVGVDKLSESLEDIVFLDDDYATLLSCKRKLDSVKQSIGYAKFNLISFDEVIKIANDKLSVVSFSIRELEMLDKFFYDDPSKYGFYGTKTVDSITTKIDENLVEKIPFTGHYLYKGEPFENYNRIKKDIGRTIVLTSGIRSVPKQMSLYIDKIVACKGNISQASKVIAPPAYSYHSVSDFDVGTVGLGARNFSSSFAKTKEYKSLVKLHYVDIRYQSGNADGVIFEPWHIKVV